eukprot:CAMPEP_0114347878 /NCGR_PEP_ID=MMETSP0101-20121206/14271_1 /TAXON_ID=38822 ORGANISM="Pteridomonas danica, Strain PT" /NCGR_SAMPLE_ID=MMETSP0101 /ASSEMBLY_ACC=CAM_ASM_000211 /LENGTH=273 /DNA_ID=CAMNT_0001485489 /DNA_START=34 /DNA_END=855 /DNA_ORIENTATION=+
MDINLINHLGPSGNTLSMEEKAAMQISMLQRSREENVGKLYFWGKIMGETNDYLIAYALSPTFGFPTKKFFYCTTGDFTLGQIPPVTPEWAKMASAISMPFRGEPSLPLLADGTEGDPDEVEGDGPPPERFREMHRLSFVVGSIDHDAAVLPRGAFVVDASHKVLKNKSYEGLSFEAAGSLANYYHFRAPESARAKAAFAKPGIVRPSDFMDPVVDDQPEGVWSCSYDPSATTCILRNFYWPGYFFFHVMDTSDYGGVYFGDGLPNVDIAFML